VVEAAVAAAAEREEAAVAEMGCGAAAEASAAEAQRSEEDDVVVSCMAQTRNHKHSPTEMLAAAAGLVAAEAPKSGFPTSSRYLPHLLQKLHVRIK
jgi:hypothetical protein